MSADIAKLKEELYEWCGGNAACVRAAEYYIAQMQNPCYPPIRPVYNKYYMEIMKMYGSPPKCDVKALVKERLWGTPLEKHIDEIVELAELIRRRLHTRSRTAAAVAAIIVAERRGYVVVYKYVAARFGVSDNVMRMWLPRARKLVTAVTTDTSRR